jgi:hypothetical protein
MPYGSMILVLQSRARILGKKKPQDGMQANPASE